MDLQISDTVRSKSISEGPSPRVRCFSKQPVKRAVKQLETKAGTMLPKSQSSREEYEL